jgi:hypothetical protein
MANDKVFPRGIRPVSLQAVSERERMKAHPHRHASVLMLARAQRIAGATAPLKPESAELDDSGADDAPGGSSDANEVSQ